MAKRKNNKNNGSGADKPSSKNQTAKPKASPRACAPTSRTPAQAKNAQAPTKPAASSRAAAPISRTLAQKKPERKKLSSKSSKLKVNPFTKFFRYIAIKIEFHKDNNGGHHHAILDEVDNKNVSVGFTTQQKKGKNHPNKKLDIDPLSQGKNVYMRKQATIDDKTNYNRPKSGKMSKQDYKTAKGYANKAKNKYLEKKENKKK